jgi:ABC-type branched-subunit amino acid transport system substrate-binding protein
MVRLRLLLSAALLFVACAASQPTPRLPGTFGTGEPLPPPVAPEAGSTAMPALPPGAEPDPGAEADFGNAKAKFDAGDRAAARAALEAFATNHPQHPFRPTVDLMLARLALLRGDAAGAKTLLDPIVAPAEPNPPVAGPGAAGLGPTDVRSSARYYLGLAEVQLGQAARGRDLLLPFLPPAGTVGANDEALVELRGALAEASMTLGQLPAALELWDGYLRGGREPEKAYARLEATEIASAMTPEAAARAFPAASERGLARAVLGAKAAGVLRAQGNASGAAAIDSETAAARAAVGMEDERARSAEPGDPGRIGLAVALSGKFQPVGEAAMRAAMLAVGAPSTASVQLFVRDAGSDAGRVGKGVADLAREGGVIGIVAAADRKTVDGASVAASEAGLPALLLDDSVPGAQGTGFQLVHAPAARAQALARAALKLGAREFATLGPDSAAGTALRQAFRQAVESGGGKVTADGSYPPGSTSFTAVVASLKKAPPQVVFVADGADKLELIAPALAAADLWPAPWGAKRPPPAPGKPKVRNVLLLSTAADLSPRLLQNAGRYVQGALLAPGFYADPDDARARDFVAGYRAAYGQDPHATEAYAFDGVNALRAATAAGARTRADLLRALAAGTFDGLTGALRFSADHGRVDSPRIYVVDGEAIKTAAP